MNSYQSLSFHEQSALPRFIPNTASVHGKCLPNIDGQCISGGTSFTGLSGYNIASMGFGNNDDPAMLNQIAKGMNVGGGYPTPSDVMSTDGIPVNRSGAQCVGMPIFLATNRPYALYGMQVAANANLIQGLSPYYKLA